MRPEARRRAAALLVAVAVVAWPVTALTVFRTEPQGVLGLSYLAIILAGLDILATTDVRAETDEEEPRSSASGP